METKPLLPHSAPRPLAPALVSEETKAGLGRASSRTTARSGAPSEEGLPKQAAAPGPRSLPVTLWVAPEEAARRDVVTPQSLSEATDHLLARRRGGGGKHRPRQARVKGIEAGLVSEETGHPTITETKRGYKPAEPGPATPPEGGEASLEQQQASNRGQSWHGKHFRRSASAALTSQRSPACSNRAVLNPGGAGKRLGHQTGQIHFRRSKPAKPCVQPSSEGSCHPRATKGSPDSNKRDTTKSLTTLPVNVIRPRFSAR
jgi:hypothetical protein